MIKLKDLQYLSALDEYRHFGQAAEACFVSQPTLSGQIKKLEEQLDLLLIERHRNNVMLTPAGLSLVEKARSVLTAAKDFEETAKTLTDPLSGQLHIGLIPTLAPYLLPHIMKGLNEDLPNIEFYLYENQTEILLDKLQSGSLDILILPWLDDMHSVTKHHLFDEALLLALPKSHQLANKKNIDLSDLKNNEILVLEDGHCLRQQSLDYCFSAGAKEDKRFSATSLETLRYMVASGLGITLLPELAIKASSPSNGDIVYKPFANDPPYREIVLLTRTSFSRAECIRIIIQSIQAHVYDN